MGEIKNNELTEKRESLVNLFNNLHQNEVNLSALLQSMVEAREKGNDWYVDKGIQESIGVLIDMINSNAKLAETIYGDGPVASAYYERCLDFIEVLKMYKERVFKGKEQNQAEEKKSNHL